MFWQSFREFMAKPFSSDDMDAGHWFLFIGLLIVITIIWRLIFQHIQEAV